MSPSGSLTDLAPVRGISRAFRNRNYRLYAAGNAVSLVGFWTQRVAVGWLTWELTESAVWLGLMAAADALPTPLLAPWAGVIADRFDRLRVIRVTQAAQTLQATTLALLSWAGLLTIGPLLVLAMVLGTIQSIAQPVRLALVPSLVAHADLSAAVALNSSLFNLARFVGPALAGVLITTTGSEAAFAGSALCFGFLLLALTKVRVLRVEVGEPPAVSLLAQFVEGLRYASAHESIRFILVLVLVSTVLSRAFLELLPGYAAAVFGRGADGLAILIAAVGAGAMGSSLWLAGRETLTGSLRIGAGALLVTGAALAGFAGTNRFAVGVAMMLVLGFANVGTSIVCQTLLQNTVDGRMRGRMMSIYGLVFRVGPAAGALVMGALSEVLGLRIPLVLGAAGCAACWLWARQRLRRLAPELEGRPGSAAIARSDHVQQV